MIHNNKKVIASVIYRSPSQNNCELDSFLTNFDHILSEINKYKPSVILMQDLPHGGQKMSILRKDQNCFR